MEEEEKKKHGRWGEYHDWVEGDGLLKVAAWKRDGLLDKQIYKNIGISHTTFYEWKDRYPAFAEALKKAKEVADIEVENALFKSALGFETEEETKEIINGELVTTKIIKKKVHPNLGAQVFWLKNRKPEDWKDKPKLEISGIDEINKNIASLADVLANPQEQHKLEIEEEDK